VNTNPERKREVQRRRGVALLFGRDRKNDAIEKLYNFSEKVMAYKASKKDLAPR